MLDRIDRATDKVALVAIRRGTILPIPEKLIKVDAAYVQKSGHGFYNILNSSKDVIYKDICVFDVAVIVAQKYSKGQRKELKTVLSLESSFFKYHTDMTYYLNCMRKVKVKKDMERLCILEDKFQMAEVHANDLRDKISFFKRVK